MNSKLPIRNFPPSVFKLENGDVILDNDCFDRFPFWLLPNQPNNSVTLSSNRSSIPLLFSVSKDSPMEITRLTSQQTSTSVLMELRIQDGDKLRELQNAPLHLGTLFGSGQQPYYLPQGLFLDEGHVFEARMADFSGASNTIRLAAGGRRLRKPVADPTGAKARERLKRRQYLSIPFFYTFDKGGIALSGNGTSQQTISIDNEFHFAIHQISFVSTSNLFTLDIFNQATGESIINAPSGVHYETAAQLFMGTNNFPYKLFEPWFIGAGEKLQINLTDTSGSTNTVFVTLGGIAYRTGEYR